MIDGEHIWTVFNFISFTVARLGLCCSISSLLIASCLSASASASYRIVSGEAAMSLNRPWIARWNCRNVTSSTIRFNYHLHNERTQAWQSMDRQEWHLRCRRCVLSNIQGSVDLSLKINRQILFSLSSCICVTGQLFIIHMRFVFSARDQLLTFCSCILLAFVSSISWWLAIGSKKRFAQLIRCWPRQHKRLSSSSLLCSPFLSPLGTRFDESASSVENDNARWRLSKENWR